MMKSAVKRLMSSDSVVKFGGGNHSVVRGSSKIWISEKMKGVAKLKKRSTEHSIIFDLKTGEIPEHFCPFINRLRNV